MLAGGGLFFLLALPLLWWSLTNLVQAGDKGVDLWIASLIRDIADTHLKPSFTFESLEYDYPRTVILSDCRLTAEDPGADGAPVDVFAVDRLELELVEIPETGKPMHIERIILARPTVRLLVHEDERRMLVGYGDLLKPVEDAPADASGEVRASDVLRIRSLSLEKGTIHYDPRREGQTPMRLDGITTVMRIDPDSTALYDVDAVLEREPMLGFRIQGRLNADNMTMDVSEMNLSVRLGREYDHHLPPPAQAVLKRYDVAADLRMKVHGQLLAADLGGSSLAGVLELEEATMGSADYRFPIDALEMDCQLSARKVVVDRLTMQTLGGLITGQGSLDIDDALATDFELEMTNVRLEQLCRLGSDPDAEPRFAGRVDGTASVAGPLRSITREARGQGQFQLREGRVGRLPVVSPVAEVLGGAMGLLTFKGKRLPKGDEADVVVTLEGDHAHCSSIQLRGAGYSVRGEGRIYFDSELDMKFNGGPLEKFQDQLGAAGRATGHATDAIVKYIVRGTLADPKVGVKFADVRKTKPREPKPEEAENEEATATAPSE